MFARIPARLLGRECVCVRSPLHEVMSMAGPARAAHLALVSISLAALGCGARGDEACSTTRAAGWPAASSPPVCGCGRRDAAPLVAWHSELLERVFRCGRSGRPDASPLRLTLAPEISCVGRSWSAAIDPVGSGVLILTVHNASSTAVVIRSEDLPRLVVTGGPALECPGWYGCLGMRMIFPGASNIGEAVLVRPQDSVAMEYDVRGPWQGVQWPCGPGWYELIAFIGRGSGVLRWWYAAPGSRTAGDAWIAAVRASGEREVGDGFPLRVSGDDAPGAGCDDPLVGQWPLRDWLCVPDGLADAVFGSYTVYPLDEDCPTLSNAVRVWVEGEHADSVGTP